MIEIWEGLLIRLSGDEILMTAIILWNLWNFRNKVGLNGLQADQSQILS